MIGSGRALRPLRVASAALLAAAAAFGSIDAMAIEEPAYTVAESDDRFEVRDYAGYVVAQTLVDGDAAEAGSEGFRRLYRYISGANRVAARIEMTAPVEQQASSAKIAMTAPVEQQRSAERWRVAFVLPATYARAAEAPVPTDERVVLADVAPRRVAVVRYRGTWSDARYEQELAALRAYIDRRGFVAVGEPLFARYDPPFMPPFLRRNEIQVELARKG